ncbi:hypothetical protein [Halalkalicoccus sp. NIPERK01]|uniref:DUF7504 family protein n=1 Tax=Halalkalicoccus sp. NIPERK01 TaxID=3053469 RepID=UPI00256F3DB5|nr:hypothetical protein [Halalkalicoccus sp. NIPERK01]MDL5361084.1 hypothetical protein [Halalkalicoccus sp. NIPERK01]
MSPRIEVEGIVESVPAGSALLVSGPPMTGKYDLFVRLLAGSEAIAITTDTDASTLREDYAAVAASERLSIVDCVSRSRGAATADSADVRYVPGPGNLTRIGTAFTDLVDSRTGDDVRVGLHSVSPLVMAAELRSVYRFLQVFTGQVRSAGWLCLATFDPTMHDERTVNTVLDPFDACIDTRERDGRREARIRGFDSRAGEWTPF